MLQQNKWQFSCHQIRRCKVHLFTVYWSICRSQTCNCKRAVIGSKGGWKLSTIFLSCEVFHDWTIIKVGNISYLLDGYIFAVLFETTPHCFCLLRLLVQLKNGPCILVFFSRIFLSCRVPTFRGQKVVKHGSHRGISFMFID